MQASLKWHILYFCRLTVLTLASWPSTSRTLTLVWLPSRWQCRCKTFIPKALSALMDLISKDLLTGENVFLLKSSWEADSLLVFSLPCWTLPSLFLFGLSLIWFSLSHWFCLKESSLMKESSLNIIFLCELAHGPLILWCYQTEREKSFKQFSDSP